MRRAVVVAVLLTLVAGILITAGVAVARDGRTGFEIDVFPVLEADIPIDQGWVLQDRMESLEGEVLGWDGGTCVSVDPDPLVADRYMCELVFHFPHGDIVAAGAFSIPEWLAGDTVFAVTGGSGAFRFVRGDVQVIPTPDLSSSRVVFRVTGNHVSY